MQKMLIKLQGVGHASAVEATVAGARFSLHGAGHLVFLMHLGRLKMRQPNASAVEATDELGSHRPLATIPGAARREGLNHHAAVLSIAAT